MEEPEIETCDASAKKAQNFQPVAACSVTADVIVRRMPDIFTKLFSEIVQCRRWNALQLLWKTPEVPKVRQLSSQPNPHCVAIAA